MSDNWNYYVGHPISTRVIMKLYSKDVKIFNLAHINSNDKLVEFGLEIIELTLNCDYEEYFICRKYAKLSDEMIYFAKINNMIEVKLNREKIWKYIIKNKFVYTRKTHKKLGERQGNFLYEYINQVQYKSKSPTDFIKSLGLYKHSILELIVPEHNMYIPNQYYRTDQHNSKLSYIIYKKS